MSFFDIIDRRQPATEPAKEPEKVTPMPRLSLDDLEKLPADFDPRTDYPIPPEKLFLARKKPGRPPKAKVEE